jgi:radical SAM superfamily enzyme YgiQ (UPF0313 family)
MSETELKYLAHKNLKDVPGFTAAIQLQTRQRGAVFVGVRSDALSVFTDEGRQYFYDLEGRPWRLSSLNTTIQRGLSHNAIRLTKRPKEEGGGFGRERLTDDQLREFCLEMWETGAAIRDALERHPGDGAGYAKPDHVSAMRIIQPLLDKITHYTPDVAANERDRFAAVYQPVPVLPPDHYRTLVLQATEGCSFNTCTFCSLYRGIPFRVRSVKEFDAHIRRAAAFHGESLRQRSTIFLGQANAISIPQHRLTALMRRIPEHFTIPPLRDRPVKPSWTRGRSDRFTGVGAFIDGFTGLKKSTEEYRELMELGLDRVYLGVESGSGKILDWLQKPAQPDQMLETLGRLKKAGAAADIIVLVGIGGKAYEREHTDATVKFIGECPLAKGDRVYLSEVVEYSGAPYARRMEEDRIARLNPGEMNRQMEAFKTAARKKGVQPVPYRIDPFVY